MERSVAFPAQRDQVILSIITELAWWFNVVNFQSSHRAAKLAAPVVALHDRLTEQKVGSESSRSGGALVRSSRRRAGACTAVRDPAEKRSLGIQKGWTDDFGDFSPVRRKDGPSEQG
jgi:hypothetical protein